MLPKLWKTLKSGGGGNAETIYPHLLPLLSKLEHDILGSKTITFYRNFFENINIGLQSRVVMQNSSRADTTAIATAYFECLQFVLIRLQSNLNVFDADLTLMEFSLKIVDEHLLGVIGFLLKNSCAHNAKYVLMRVAVLIQFWNQTNDENALYSTLLDHFWSELATVIEKSLSTERDDQTTIACLELIFDFIQYLRNQSSAMKSKSAKVKFIESDESQTQESGSTAESISTPSGSCCETELRSLVIDVCKLYISKTSETTNFVYINHIEKLLKMFGDKDFFEKLAVPSGDIAKLYDKFASWLLIAQLRQENVVDIILQLYPHLDSAEKSKLLNKLIKFPNEIVQNWILSRILSHPLCTEPDAARLLVQPTTIELLMKNARAVLDGNVTEPVNLLHKCFFQNESGDIQIDQSTCEGIIEIISKPLIDGTQDEGVLDVCASFLAQIMPVICSDERKKRLQIDIFVKLFNASVDKRLASKLSEETQWEVLTSWQDALSSRDIHMDDDLLTVCSKIINDILAVATNQEDYTTDCIESISENVAKLVLCSIENLDKNDDNTYSTADKIVKTILEKSFDRYTEQLTNLKDLCRFLGIVDANISTNVATDLNTDICSVNTVDTVATLLKTAIFRFCVVFKITCSVKKSARDGDQTAEGGTDDERTEDYCDLDETLLKQWSQQIYDEILNALYVAALGDRYLEHFHVRISMFILYLGIRQ